MLPNELLRYERKMRHNMTQQELAKKLVAKPDPEFDRMPLLKRQKDEFKDTVRKIKRWEQGLTPIPHYQRELARVFKKDVHELGYPPEGTYPRIPFWHVPHYQPSQSEFFMDREDYLLRLHSVVALRNQQYTSDEKKSDEKTAHTILKPQALVGLGGIGKSQIAIDYAYRYAYEYQIIIWLRASSYEILAADFANIATIVNLPQRDLEEQALRIKIVKDWLMYFTRWLLIFDDAEDVEIIRDFLPPKCFGHIIITTRSAATGKLAQAIEVEKIPLGEATSFLLRRSKIIESEAVRTETVEENYVQAREIAKLFDGLPLMLEQAGAYIDTTGCGLAGYLADYKAQGTLLRQKPKLPEKEYPHTVATAWQLSFKKVRQANLIAADLLSLFAFLAPAAIPEEMITDAAMELSAVLSALIDNPSALDDAMAELRKYSLVNRHRHEDSKTCSIHSLVQEVLKDGMDQNTQRQWAELAVKAVNYVFPSSEPSKWRQCERYLSQAYTCEELIKRWKMMSIEAGQLLYKIGLYCIDRALYAQAELVLQEAVPIYEHNFGSESIEIATIIDYLADVYQDQDKFAEALPYRERVLKIRETTLKQDDPEIAEAFNGLAMIYHNLGDYVLAEKYYLRAIEISENAIDAITPQKRYIIHHLGNLANLYRSVGRHKEGIELAKRSLEISIKKLGFDHPQTAHALNSLATLYERVGNLLEAKKLHEQALSIRQRLLPPDHPDISMSLNNLAVVYHQLGEYSQAEVLFKQALEIDKKVFGLTHSMTAHHLCNLGVACLLQKRYDEAEEYLLQAKSLEEEILGTNHPELLSELNHLTDLYLTQVSYEKAKSCLTQALSILEEKPEVNRLYLAKFLQHYGRLYTAQGHFQEAEAAFKRSLNIFQNALGETDAIPNVV